MGLVCVVDPIISNSLTIENEGRSYQCFVASSKLVIPRLPGEAFRSATQAVLTLFHGLN